MAKLNSSAISRQGNMCTKPSAASWRPRHQPTGGTTLIVLDRVGSPYVRPDWWAFMLISIGWLANGAYCLDPALGHQESDTSLRGSEGQALGSSYEQVLALGEPLALFGGEKPRIIPLVAADSGYSENSSVNILCTVSQGHHESLTFDWYKDGQLILDNNAEGETITGGHMYEKSVSNGKIRGTLEDRKSLNMAPEIEKHQDHSLLRISHVQSQHSGRYTCSVKNQFGQDSSSVNLIVNVKLQWIKEPPKEIVVSLNQELKVDCLAQGEPKPSMKWLRLDSATIPPMGSSSRSHQLASSSATSAGQSLDSGTMLNALTSGKNQLAQKEANGYKLVHQKHHIHQIQSNDVQQNGVIVSSGRHLNIQRAKESDSGIYECIASNAHDTDLRRLVHVQVRVPARFAEKFSVVQAKGGESAKLECNATGDQPLSVNWFKEDTKMSKRGGENFEIYETIGNAGVNSILVIRTVNRADALTYKCVAENEYGNDERLIKLTVVEVPSRPMNVRVKDAWTRSASITWSTPFSGNSPISSYIIQYWKKGTNEAGQSIQNHRRQEFSVGGSQTTALIANLSPAVTYEASVIAENQIGRSEPSENVIINTGEDEPTAAPSDVSVEARGPSTIKVSWKAPPSEHWNGKLVYFHVGFRQRATSNSIDGHHGQSNPQAPFSYRTVEYVKGQQNFEAFLTNLARGQEYEVVVKAFNNAGYGPESHLMSVKTFDGDLPASPSLFAHQTTQSSIALRWTYPSRAQSSSNPIKRYILYYQRQGDDSWLEIGIPIEDKLRSPTSQIQDGSLGQISISESGTTSFHLSSLDPGFTYRIYVVAVNNFGMGDPSNIVTTKTDQIIGGSSSASHSTEFNVFEMNRQFQLFLVVPVICTIIMVVVILAAVWYCSRRMQTQQPTQHIVTSQPQTLQSNGGGPWGPEGTIQVGQRYVEFDKGGILKTNGSLLTGTQGSDQTSSGHPNNMGPGQHFQLPYGTMPMNSVVITDQKSWDRQSTAPLKPLVSHIYDSPI